MLIFLSFIDLLGLVYEIGPEIIVKSERRSSKREIKLLDSADKMVHFTTNHQLYSLCLHFILYYQVVITMWGETADNIIKTVEGMDDDVIVLFGGLQYSTYPRSNSDTYLDSFDDSIIMVRK